MAFTRRLQLLLDDTRYERVARAAEQRQTSVAAVIRDAIDHSLAPADNRRSRAARRILAADPMEVPSADDLLVELDDLRGRR